MTQSEEIVTLKGESRQSLESVFLYNQHIETSYRSYIEDRNQLEIRLSHKDDTQSETFQMIFVLDGKLRITRCGSSDTFAQIESHQHNLCRLPFKSSRLWTNTADYIICINISIPFLRRFLPEDHIAYKKLFIENSTENPLILSEQNMQITPEINLILQRLSNSSQSGFPDQLLLESKVIELLALQIAQLEQMQHHKVPVKMKRVEVDRMHEARNILINQSDNQLSLRALAHMVGTNEFNLKRDFKALFGLTVFTYLNQHKMEKAKSMLVDEDITVAEISKKMGYKHPTHFTSAFKKYFGFLPNQIRMGKFSMLIFFEDFHALFETLTL